MLPTGNRRNRALFTRPKKISPASQTVTTVRIVPKICQGQPPTMYSECSRFHSNPFTFGWVIAERVNNTQLPRKVNPIFAQSIASRRIIITIGPVQDWQTTLRNWHFCQLQSHVTQKLWQISQIRPEQILILCPGLRISGQLPAPFVNGGRHGFWKWLDFRLWRARDLDLGSGHPAYLRAPIINLYVHAKFNGNQRYFLWMDVRTYKRRRTDGHLRPTHFMRSNQKSRPNNIVDKAKVHLRPTLWGRIRRVDLIT